MASNSKLSAGASAPDFNLPVLHADGDGLPQGENLRLSDLRGRHVVLYFYPKDMTPGCTTEACDFRDRTATLREAGAVVLGISPDTIDSHRKFADKHELTFPLLSDPDRTAIEAYGLWVEKNMYGKKSFGVQRATFLINPEGTIAAVWPRVKVAGHADAVLEKLNEMRK